MANRLQLRRGSGAPGGVFYEGEPIYDKIGKVLFVGNNGASGSGAGSSIASEDTHLSSLEILSRASSTSPAFIKLGEDTDNGNHYVSLKAPASIASNFTLTLPSADGSSGQVLRTNGEGTLSFATLLTDLVSDTTPQLGGNLDLNSKDITGTGNLNVTGIVTATTLSITGNTTLGDAYTDSVVFNAYVGSHIKPSGSYNLGDSIDKWLNVYATNFYGSGAGLTGVLKNVVEDTTPQLGGNLDLNSNDITGTGNLNVTGIVTATSFVKSGGTSSQFLKADGSVDSSTYITSADGGNAATLDGIDSTSFLRSDQLDIKTSGNLTFNDSIEARFGTNGDLQIGHDGTDSHIKSLDKDLNIELDPDGSNPKIYIRPTTTTQGITLGGGSGNPVELYYNNTKKFETTNAGATLTGTLAVDGLTLGSLEYININSNQLKIYSDGTNAYIDASASASGHLYIRNNTGEDVNKDIYIQAKSGENSIVCTNDAAVELYYDNSKKFETTGGGASVTGDLYVSGNLNVVGTAVTFSTETVKVEDRILELGLVNGAAPTSNTTWELGVLFNYNTGVGDGTPKKSGVVWLDNTFIAAAASVTESADTGNADPQVSVSTLASFVANDLYLGGTASGNQIINSSGQAQNLVFDGGSY